jgi:hypothetical protein
VLSALLTEKDVGDRKLNKNISEGDKLHDTTGEGFAKLLSKESKYS